MRQVQVLIIGGGPSGLALAYELQGDTLILEKENKVGGLCRSIVHRNGVFDIGGHSFHTPYTEVYDLVQMLLEGGLFQQQREAFIYTHGQLISYPFQKNFDQLSNQNIVRECEEGLRNISGDAGEADNFEQYIIRKFGSGIAEHFMLPYNRKLWGRDLKLLSCEWTTERVAGPKGESEKFETSGGQRKPLQSDTIVGYPRQGGFEEIYRSFVPHIPKVELNKEIVDIDPRERTAYTSDGDSFQWECLVSTMPLPMLVRIIRGVPAEIIHLADELAYMSLRVELLLTHAPLDTPIQRIYIADNTIPPHKIAINHNSSDYLRQQPHHAIMAEVSLASNDGLDADLIAPATIKFLCELGILSSPQDVIWSNHINVKYAYPIYTHSRPLQVQTIKSFLSSLHIYTLGRFGDWEYINSDKCIMKGLSLGQDLRKRYATDSSV